MDEKNNFIAAKYAEKLKRSGRLNAEQLDKAALSALKKNELVVIKKMGGPK